MTESATTTGKRPSHRVGLLMVLGILAVVGGVGVDAWLLGYFKPKPKVMNKANISDLRADHMVRSPG